MSDVLGLVLAGGLARRMGGGDKPLLTLGGVTLLDRTIARLGPQCGGMLLNANGDPARFAAAGLPVVPDSEPDFPGPLAGILAGLDWAAAQKPDVEWVASLPGDCPFLPHDLVRRLRDARARSGMPIACARSGERRHPVVGLWPVALRGALRRSLRADGERRVEAWAAGQGVAWADWPAEPVDPFFNVNTLQDAAEAERILLAHPGA